MTIAKATTRRFKSVFDESYVDIVYKFNMYFILTPFEDYESIDHTVYLSEEYAILAMKNEFPEICIEVK